MSALRTRGRVGRRIAEAGDRERLRGEQLEGRRGLGAFGDRAGEAVVAADASGEALGADLEQGRPDQHATRLRGLLDAVVEVGRSEVGELRTRVDRLGRGRFEVLGVPEREGAAEQGAVANEDRAAADAGGEPLVGVDGEGVGLGDALEERGGVGVEHAGQPVGAVDVQPDVVLSAGFDDLGDGVNGAGVDRAGRGGDGDRGAARGAVGHEALAQRGDVEAVAVVHGQFDDGGASKAKHRRGAVDDVVDLARGVEARLR